MKKNKASIDDEGAVPLDMANIVGVFYVLIAGTVFAIIYGGIDFMIRSYDLAKRHKVCESASDSVDRKKTNKHEWNDPVNGSQYLFNFQRLLFRFLPSFL